MFSICQVDHCMGLGNEVLVNGCARMRICPRHQIELSHSGNEVMPLEGKAPWLETQTELAQADGDCA